MSFRDTFTRNDNSSENLQYDDNAAYHFYTTILLLVFLPLAYSICKTVINPFSHIPRLKQIENIPQFSKKIKKFKRDNKYSYINCWFVVKLIIMGVVVYGLVSCFLVLSQTGDGVKGFDPYEILGVDASTPVEKIKKSYRKLALMYHPDRNPGDPEANAKFIMISKAYECLTNEEAKQNCLKFGNPEGSPSINVGIALPSFLVHKDNKVIIMGIVFLLVVIVLPLFLIYYFSEVNKYDENGMLQESHPFIHSSLNQQLSIRDCVKVLALCAEFKNLRINKQQSEKLEMLFKQADEDMKKVFMKKKFFNYIKKAMVLIDARVTDKKIPEELMDDFRYIMKKMPVLVNASVMLGLERSNQMVMRYRPEAFVGGNALKSLIMFGQYFIQGKSLEAESFEQLDFTEEQVDKIYKKKKKRGITSIADLKNNEEDREYLFSLLTPERSAFIKQVLDYIPKIEEIACLVHTAGDRDLTALDILEVIVDIKSDRKSNFCSALKYPFLKMEGWYVIVTDGNAVVFQEHFSFQNSNQYQIKFNRGPYQKAGNYSLTINVLSDCYFGIDMERIVKFEIGAAKKVDKIEQEVHPEEEDTSLFTRLMKGMMPQEEEELSDKEEEEETKTPAKKDNSSMQLESKSE